MTETIFLLLPALCLPAGIFTIAAAILHKLPVPHRIFVILWVILGIRLLVPIHLESPFGIPGMLQSSENTGLQTFPADPGDGKPDAVPMQITPNPEKQSPKNPKAAGMTKTKTPAAESFHPLKIAEKIWLCGMCLILAWGIVRYIRLRLVLRDAVHLRENVWQGSRIASPFLFGIIKPRIYIPFGMEEHVLEYVLLHENTHRKNKDHVIKLMWYAVTAVYWFHPLVWLAYVLLCRDIEMACDEQVIREMDSHGKKCYANALLEAGAGQKLFSVYPVSFGEVGVKMRIQNMLNYKKPSFYVVLLCVILCAVLAATLLTSPPEQSSPAAKNTEQTPGAREDVSQTKETLVFSGGKVWEKIPFTTTCEVDLDGDQNGESILAETGKDSENNPMPELTVSGKTFDASYMHDKLSFYMEEPETNYFYLMDLDTSDPFVEIAFFEYGPSDDPRTSVLRYADNELVMLGSFSASPEDSLTTIRGDGTILAQTRCDIIQTDWIIGEWELTANGLEAKERTEGDFLSWEDRYHGDYPVTAKRDFRTFLADPLSSAVATVKKGDRIGICGFRKEEDFIDIYFYYPAENGEDVKALFHMKDGDPYTVILPLEGGEETESVELLDGLSFAD